MKICIDISQLAYPASGVYSYTLKLVENLLKIDKENEYILFFSSLRRNIKNELQTFKKINSKVKIKTFKFPSTLLELFWNRLHSFPIEWLVGRIDLYFSSDWTQAPSKAKKVTVVHDLSFFHFPETFHPKIIQVQKRRLFWVKKECDLIICDSRKTKEDLEKYLKIEEKKLKVVYPGGVPC